MAATLIISDLPHSRDCGGETTLAGKKEEDKGQPLTDDVATYSRDASDEERSVHQ